MTFGINDAFGHGKTIKSDNEVIRSRDDREMVLRPHLWPNKDNLPLKNPLGTQDRLGLLLKADGGPPFRVYVGMIFEDPRTLPVFSYSTVDDMIADGWLVD